MYTRGILYSLLLVSPLAINVSSFAQPATNGLILRPLSSGVVTFDPIPNAASYTVQWASSTNGPWHTNWDALSQIAPTNNSFSVPLFFGLVASMKPEPQNLVALNTTVDNTSINGEVLGNYNSTHDGDDATYYGAYRYHDGDGDASCSISSDHTWTNSAHVNSIRVKMSSLPHPHGNYPHHQCTFGVYLLENGVWTSVYSEDSTYIEGGGAPTDRDIQLSTGWDGVTGIRGYVYTDSYSYEGDRAQDSSAIIYEIQALGN